MKKALKIVGKILLVLLILIVVAAIAVSIIANKNVKAMNECIDETINTIAADHTLTEVDAGEYSEMSVYGIMKFHVKQYDIEDIGNLSVMKVNVGLMQMATVVITPTEKDMPLLSCDYMYILTNRKAYVELYDLVEEKDDAYIACLDKFSEIHGTYGDLEEIEASSAWYDDLLTVAAHKAGGTKDDERIKSLLIDTVQCYLDQADEMEALSADAKSAKLDIIKEYSDNLIANGGISTDFFKQSLGEDITRDFFDKTFFGTEQYR